jgi:hypothetical protein
MISGAAGDPSSSADNCAARRRANAASRCIITPRMNAHPAATSHTANIAPTSVIVVESVGITRRISRDGRKGHVS